MPKIVMTGGHHNSAIPVIEKLKQTIPELELYWFGHKHTVKGDENETLEYKEITQLKIPFYDLKAGKLYKTYDFRRLAKIPMGFFHALYLLYKIKPDLIVSFGGYLAAPTVIAGNLLGIKSVTHEQTVVAGYANKLIAKYADKIMISWPQSKVYFPDGKVVVTGLPLREELTHVTSNSFEITNYLPTIYITAGKTGSHIINLTVKESLKEMLSLANIIHQCGDTSVFNDYEELTEYYETIKNIVPGRYFPRKFVFSDEIGEAFSKAQLIVSRSGAHTTAEILYLEKPAILIPIPWVSHNEQLENAKIIKSSGLGIILEEKDLSSNSLLDTITFALQNLTELKLKDPVSKSNIRVDAVDMIVKTIEPYLSNVH